jgi:hypothetical protein
VSIEVLSVVPDSGGASWSSVRLSVETVRRISEVWRQISVIHGRGAPAGLFFEADLREETTSNFLIRRMTGYGKAGWVAATRLQTMQCPLYPQKQTCAVQLGMSALCQ